MAYVLTEEGKRYLEKGLPEKNLIALLETGSVKINEARRNVENFHIALQWAKKNNWVKISGENIILIKKPSSIPEQSALEKIENDEPASEDVISILLQRRLIEKMKAGPELFTEKEVSGLTPEILKTKAWKDIKIKPYNVEASGKRIYPGKMHILSAYMRKIRNIFLDLGFNSTEGPLI